MLGPVCVMIQGIVNVTLVVGLCCNCFSNPIGVVAGVRTQGLCPTEYIPPGNGDRIQSTK
jgi:hypothetical protein